MIELKMVNKAYGAQKVLEDVTVTLERGRVHGFVGRNGSGKTVLLKCIAGLSRRFAKKGFAFKLLREDKDRLLVYICHRGRLEAYLFLPEVRAFLKKFGYTYSSAGEALEQLEGRMNGEFPHEIGVFLGYPLADVCGFLRDPNGCILCGCWKVYANADEAAKTFERFRRCSACICLHLQRGRSLSQIFNVV